MTVLFFIVKGILCHTLPAYDIMLVKDFSFNSGFAKNDGYQQEHQHSNHMR